jgi:hypothetical protein
MSSAWRAASFLFVLTSLGVFSLPALAHVQLGAGNAALLGGDLTDPENDVVDKVTYSGDLSEDQLRPEKGNWVTMKAFPSNPPGTPAHQRHPYQSWQDQPAVALFLNKPQERKWYVGFKDGGYGGPTEDSPYYAAVQFAKPIILTHFTLTTGQDMPGRDPRVWAIQASNTGEEDDWTDVYRCDAAGRASSPLTEEPRIETILFTSFTSADLAKAVPAADAKKVVAKLNGQAITKADFVRPAGAYTWYRVAVFACFNDSTMDVPDATRPPGFAIGQLELFGVPGTAAPAKAAAEEAAPVGIEPVRSAFDPAFIISFWCGPPKAEATLERYQEVADCGFNVAFISCNEPDDPLTRLELCRQVGIKAMIGIDLPASETAPDFQKVLDTQIAKYASHPALHSYVIDDEPGREKFARLGAINQYLLKKDPTHLPYINLLPNYAGHPDWNGPAYEESVALYIDQVKPALLSWDHYRQMFEGGDESYYWKNLEVMRKQSLKARIPLIQIIVSIKHMGYRECSEADLRWQVYTSLAYGSHGIIYFTYWDVPGMAWADAPALITMDNKRDVKWDYAKKINHRIVNLGPTLLQVTSTGVYCTEPIPPGGRRIARNAPVKKAEGGVLAIGCFVDRNAKEYILVVNRSFTDACVAKLTLNDKIVTAAEISQDSGKLLQAESVSQKTLDIALEPGDGRMYQLSRNN